jgi:hypothetical protein
MRRQQLLVSMIVYGSASLVHFVHDATYLDTYPNMPQWLTAFGVMAAWLAIATTGFVGYWLFSRGATKVGLVVMALYAALGFAGLDRYAVAPVAAHSLAMSATIVAEVVAGSVLLVVIASTALRRATAP